MVWLKKCQNKDGGFGGNIGHDSHMTSTHYAVLILLGFDRIKYFADNSAKSTCKRLLSTSVVFSSLMALSLATFGEKWTRDFLTAQFPAFLFSTLWTGLISRKQQITY